MALNVGNLLQKAFSALEKESEILHTLHPEVQSTLRRLDEQHPGLQSFLNKAHGYAVFPAVGKAAAVLGAAFGKGEVFEKSKLVGYAGLVQITLGVQIGGETFTQIVAFENQQALDRFKQSKTAFSANASATLLKAGAAVAADYEKGVAVFAYADGGMMLELALGAQKFIFFPAVLGRARKPRRAIPKRRKTSRSRGKTSARRKATAARR